MVVAARTLLLSEVLTRGFLLRSLLEGVEGRPESLCSSRELFRSGVNAWSEFIVDTPDDDSCDSLRHPSSSCSGEEGVYDEGELRSVLADDELAELLFVVSISPPAVGMNRDEEDVEDDEEVFEPFSGFDEDFDGFLFD